MPLSIRDGSVWKDGKPWVKDAGVWKPVQQGLVKEQGVWKQFYTATRPIEYIGKNYSSTSTIAIPAHQPGDLIMIFASRDASTSPSNMASGWTRIATAIRDTPVINNQRVLSAYYYIDAAGTLTAASVSNAARVQSAVFRYASGIGNFSIRDDSGTTNVTTVNLPALSISAEGSVAVACVMSAVINSNPTGMMRDASGLAPMFAYSGPLSPSTFAARSVTTSTAIANMSLMVELLRA